MVAADEGPRGEELDAAGVRRRRLAEEGCEATATAAAAGGGGVVDELESDLAGVALFSRERDAGADEDPDPTALGGLRIAGSQRLPGSEQLS